MVFLQAKQMDKTKIRQSLERLSFPLRIQLNPKIHKVSPKTRFSIPWRSKLRESQMQAIKLTSYLRTLARMNFLASFSNNRLVFPFSLDINVCLIVTKKKWISYHISLIINSTYVFCFPATRRQRIGRVPNGKYLCLENFLL